MDSVAKRTSRDLLAGLVVFLVALPLCLGIALASNAPLMSGLLAGIVGGLVVAAVSGSQTSVSGPAAGLTAVVAAQITALGSFEAFLAAVFLAGVLQLGLGIVRAGSLSAFFPSSVIKGLLAAIGVILILKQIPHVFGHDPDPMGEMSFKQPDEQNTFTEILATLGDFQPGATLIGVVSVIFLLGWNRISVLKKSPVPAPLVVVLASIGANEVLGSWTIDPSHLVEVPMLEQGASVTTLLTFPDFSQIASPTLYVAAFTIAVVASLETLLNLEAVDKIDPKQRKSPPNRELIAQGVGNMVGGFIGALPVTSVIVRSSLNIESRNETRLSAIWHGILLVSAVLLIPQFINKIPLASLAAILLVTGFKLASPKLFKQMWSEGYRQFLPFIITVVSIVMIDLLWGIIIGLVVSIGFVLRSNFRRPLRTILERHVGGDVLRIQLSTQVGFFNKAALERLLDRMPEGGHVLIDATRSHYIDADILDMIQDFQTTTGPARGVKVSLLGLKDHYEELEDHIQFVDYSRQDVREEMSPKDVLEVLAQGNKRFLKGEQLQRDFPRQIEATKESPSPLAIVLTSADSRAPVEHLFDLGIGDVFVARVAGNVASDKIIGSIEYACQVAGSKLVLVMGHTACTAVSAAVKLDREGKTASEAMGCAHFDGVIDAIKPAVADLPSPKTDDEQQLADHIDLVAQRNVLNTIQKIVSESDSVRKLCEQGKLMIVGGMYDVKTGEVEFFDEQGAELHPRPASEIPKSALAHVVAAE